MCVNSRKKPTAFVPLYGCDQKALELVTFDAWIGSDLLPLGCNQCRPLSPYRLFQSAKSGILFVPLHLGQQGSDALMVVYILRPTPNVREPSTKHMGPSLTCVYILKKGVKRRKRSAIVDSAVQLWTRSARSFKKLRFRSLKLFRDQQKGQMYHDIAPR